MLNKETEARKQSEIICVEDLVPQEHLLRKIEAAVDFDKIYNKWESCTVRTTAAQYILCGAVQGGISTAFVRNNTITNANIKKVIKKAVPD